MAAIINIQLGNFVIELKLKQSTTHRLVLKEKKQNKTLHRLVENKPVIHAHN